MSVVISPDESPFLDYLSLHFPHDDLTAPPRLEFAYARSIIRQSNAQVLAVIAAIIGPGALDSRLQHVAAHNSVKRGTIPLVYLDRDEQSHNILVGIPYTGNFLSRSPDLAAVAPHELTHTVLGKFNDGWAEPLANLFVPHRSYNAGRPQRRQQLVARAAIELFAVGAEVCTYQSLADLFSHRPYFRNVACRYFSEQPASAPGPEKSAPGMSAGQSTHRFIDLLFRRNYRAVFERHSSIELKPISDDEHRELESWFKDNESLVELRKRNPNEQKGYARTFAMQLGRALMMFLIDRGVAMTEGDAGRPEVAREALHRLLHFYFNPLEPESVQKFGFQSYDELTTEFYDDVKAKTDDFLAGHDREWELFKQELATSRCYDPEHWENDESCLNDDNNPLTRFLRSIASRPSESKGPDGPPPPPPRIYHPVVRTACLQPAAGCAFSLQGFFGAGLDYGSYCGLVGDCEV